MTKKAESSRDPSLEDSSVGTDNVCLPHLKPPDPSSPSLNESSHPPTALAPSHPTPHPAPTPRITLKFRIPARRKLDDSASSPTGRPAKIAKTEAMGGITKARSVEFSDDARKAQGVVEAEVEADGDDISMDGTTIVGEGSIEKGSDGKGTTGIGGDTLGEGSDSEGDVKSNEMIVSDSDLTSLASSDEDQAVDEGESEVELPDSDHEDPPVRIHYLVTSH